MPGCCVRTGCEGSGRGPPIGVAAGPRIRRTRRAGRAAGTRGIPGARADARRAGVQRRPRRPRPGWRGPVSGPGGRGRARGGGVVGSGGVGVVGRCSSMRRRSVGGTMRPGAGLGGGGVRGACRGDVRQRGARRGGGAGGSAATDGASATGGGGDRRAAATTGSAGAGRRLSAPRRRPVRRSGSGPSDVVRRPPRGRGFAVFTRRGGGSAGAAGFSGSGAFFAGGALLAL